MDYQKLYLMLFNAYSDIIGAIDARNYGQARELLVKVQQNCEESYISQGSAAAEADAEGILDHPVSSCSEETNPSLESGILEKQA